MRQAWPFPACIFVGVVNAVGSGLIRDVLVREEPLMFKPGQFYIIASVLGVSFFMLSAIFFELPLVPCAISAIAITFVFRLLAILFDWKTRSVLLSTGTLSLVHLIIHDANFPPRSYARRLD